MHLDSTLKNLWKLWFLTLLLYSIALIKNKDIKHYGFWSFKYKWPQTAIVIDKSKIVSWAVSFNNSLKVNFRWHCLETTNDFFIFILYKNLTVLYFICPCFLHILHYTLTVLYCTVCPSSLDPFWIVVTLLNKILDNTVCTNEKLSCLFQIRSWFLILYISFFLNKKFSLSLLFLTMYEANL